MHEILSFVVDKIECIKALIEDDRKCKLYYMVVFHGTIQDVRYHFVES